MKQIMEQSEATTAESLQSDWMEFINLFQSEGGEDGEAKWDVFAECFLRLQIDEQYRFVDYSQVESEQVKDLADEADTLASQANTKLSQEMIDQQIETFKMAAVQMDKIKDGLQEQLVLDQLAGQRVLQSHQRLEQKRKDNEAKMQDVEKQNAQLMQQKEDIQIKIQTLEREFDSLQ